MIKQTCDKCGKEITSAFNIYSNVAQLKYPKVSVLVTESPFQTRYYDFCPECEKRISKLVINFIKAED